MSSTFFVNLKLQQIQKISQSRHCLLKFQYHLHRQPERWVGVRALTRYATSPVSKIVSSLIWLPMVTHVQVLHKLPHPLSFVSCCILLRMDQAKSKFNNTERRDSRSQISVTQVGGRQIRRWGMKAFESPKDPRMQMLRRFRWRMLTRVILHFNRWAKLKTSGKDQGFVMRRMVAGRVQERIFNVEHFSKLVQQHQVLTIHAKLLLFKEPQHRCSQDLVVIVGCMNRMKCFNKYSVFIKRQLASRIRYNCYEKGTVVFKEEALPQFFYFILSGSVQFYTKAPHTVASPQPVHQDKKNVGNTIKEGEGFGELGIVEDAPRKGTIVAAEHCECFTLEKQDFIELLGAFHDEERAMKFNVIKGIPEIEGVPEADIRRAIDSSYIKTFAKGEIIVKGEDHCLARKDSKELLNSTMSCLDTYAHVVVNGSVVLEKRVSVKQEPLPCGTTIVSLPQETDTDAILNTVTHRVRESIALEQSPDLGALAVPSPPSSDPTSKYLSVCTYVPGDVFLPFVHEEEYVMGAKEATTLLFLPKTPFMLHKSGERMVKLFEGLAGAEISVNHLLREYNSARIWRDYRKQLVRTVLVDKLLRKSRS